MTSGHAHVGEAIEPVDRCQGRQCGRTLPGDWVCQTEDCTATELTSILLSSLLSRARKPIQRDTSELRFR